MKRIYCIGIGGVGMSSLALFLHESGYKVSGSDLADFRMRKCLEEKGISVYLQHKEKQVEGFDLIIYSTAIPKNNPEIQFALKNNIPIMNRLEALKHFLTHKQIVAITGSYGKSTTTAFCASIMQNSGLSPSWLVGADLLTFPPAKKGDSIWVVLESDESKQDFLDFDPFSVLVTNIGNDHLPNYDGSKDKLFAEILSFVHRRNKKTKVILNGDDSFSEIFVQNLGRDHVIMCGLGNNNQYKISNILTQWNQSSFQTSFTLKLPDEQIYKGSIAMPGENNVIDAIMALAMVVELGADLKTSLRALHYLPVMDRRFQMIRFSNKITVIDDEGDSPDVIKNVLIQAQRIFPEKKRIVILQPHRYSRLKNLFQEYADTMSSLSDEIILLPVFSAGEEELMNYNSHTLYQQILLQGFNVKNICVLSIQEAVDSIKKRSEDNLLVITLGPGDVWKVAENLGKT